MERDEIESTIPRFMASSAISRCVQCVIARPLSCGASHASATIAQICSALNVAGVPGCRGIGQPLRNAGMEVLRPLPPPPLDRGATDTECVRRRPHADTLTRQQDNPRTDRQLLRASRLSFERFQLLTLTIGDEDRGRTKQRHRKNTGTDEQNSILQRSRQKRH